jgi:hypothetical protein
MTQFNVLCKSVRFEFPPEETAKTNLLTMFSPEFVEIVLSRLNSNEIHILNRSWEQLRIDLQRYELDTIRIPLFLFHFHNYI